METFFLRNIIIALVYKYRKMSVVSNYYYYGMIMYRRRNYDLILEKGCS